MKAIIISLKIFLFFTILTGVLYPLLITGIAQFIFPAKANGSIVYKADKAVGSSLIGQQSDSSIYFSSRPSATAYNALPSNGTNYGLTNSKLKYLVDSCRQKFIAINQIGNPSEVPSEMLFSSASGLDPHISVKAALLQVERISKARNYNSNQKQELLNCIKTFTEAPQYLFLGEERINVLLLNLEMDKMR